MTAADSGGRRPWPERFFANFVAELDEEGLAPEEMAQFLWKPFAPGDLRVTGARRDRSFSKVEVLPARVENQLASPESDLDVDALLRDQKLVLLLFPGFTHHTLQYPAFQEQVGGGSPLSVLRLEPPERGRSPVERFTNGGRRGMKLVYVAYPRSNAASEIIVGPTFEMLARSRNLKRWIGEGYKLLFVGYSYGAALTLEMLAALHSGRFEDPSLLANTVGFLAINGAMGGSYLADALADPKALVNVEKAMKLASTFAPIGSPLGLKTQQERDDMVGGIESLGHRVRQARLAELADQMPPDLTYVSICAFLPDRDYDTNPLRNLDDSNLFVQSRVSADVSIYNDGQMILDDCFIPELTSVPEENRIDLGAVRTHHWGVSWKTFQRGENPFPRRRYYRALLRTLHEIGIGG